MIGQERLRPLYLLLVLGGAILAARMYWIQVREHDVWRVEAARLVHAGHVLPYRRGEIVDAHGTVLARDRGTFRLVLRYREFRRGHPLGQVAHARSLLEGRAVSLEEARARLVPWALDLVTLTSNDLAKFAKGEPIQRRGWSDPGTATPRTELRASRVADLRFYLSRLFGLSGREWTPVRKEGQRKRPDVPFHKLVAEKRTEMSEGRWTEEDVLVDVERRLVQSMQHLDRLACLFMWEEEDLIDPPLTLLIAEIEDARRLVEDAAASRLFFEATRFAPGRIEPATLLNSIDLDWIRHLFAWDELRMGEWAQTTRDGWRIGWRDGYALPHLRAELMNPRYERSPDDVLDTAAAIFAAEGAVANTLDGRPVDWRALDELEVFRSLGELFTHELDREVRAARRHVLPIQLPKVREAAVGPDDWSLLDGVLAPTAEEMSQGISLGNRIQEHLERNRSRDRDAMYELLRRMVVGWDTGFQRELDEAFTAMREGADPDDLSPDGRLVLREELRERAVERADHLLKDYGMRPRALQQKRPDYEIVYLLTRYREWFPGIEAEASSDRDYLVYEGDGGALARKLIGSVSAVTVRQLQRQRREARAMRILRNRPDRTTEEDETLRRLIGEVLLPDEVRGVAGVEGFFDPELRGTNGYEERRGLQETFGESTERIVRSPQDGQRLTLTLELPVQRAAERTLAHPPLEYGDPKFDAHWAQNPVGAIVLMTVDGDVIAAASEPTDHSVLATDVAGQRANPVERTLGKPGFQPPGSVFKPFAALYGLDRGGLDPEHLVTCGPIERGGCGYVDVRCWSTYGHGEVNLERALVESCNAYFAWLGETFREPDFDALAHAFGFGRPTGVRTAPPWDDGVAPRLGLAESVPAVFRGGRDLSDFQRRAAGNGLVVVEVTPMQLARAYAGLATGTLPDVRLAKRVGDRELPVGAGTRLPFKESAMDQVRDALAGVVTQQHGTGRKALSPAQLGVAIAAKTGSADITSRSDSDDTRDVVHKHTWIAGWLPVDDPQLVFVVFVHDTMTTSSHGAVYVAREILTQPEVRAWLTNRGVEVGEVPR